LENLSFGENELKIIAQDEKGQIAEELRHFSILKFIDFERKIDCEGCRKKKVPAASKVNMTIYLNLSHESKGVLIDYFPRDWKYEGDLNVEEFSKSHNLIKWDIEGKNIQKSYTLISPNTTLTKKYYFWSEFESYKSKEEKIVLFKFYKSVALPKLFLSDYNKNKQAIIGGIKYLKISPSNPSVLFLEDAVFENIVLFPNNSIKESSNLIFSKVLTSSKFNQKFLIETEVEADKINKIIVKFKVKKPGWKIFALKNVSAFYYNAKKNSFENLPIQNYDEDEEYFYYEVYANNKGSFEIKKKYKLNLFQTGRKS